mmetsp:Transcript_30837/g.88644  ORF Transcript_30837/g.88644 Transcript_30837/m.88644 type:complete len:728 (-) Transcript_30837:49-2232(-)
MAEAAVAEGFTPEFGEGAAAQEQVPAELNLLHFLDRKDFVDCAVRLPAPAPGSEPKGEDEVGGGSGEVVPGHRLALCSASGFFYRRLIVEAKDLTTAPVEGCGDLPAVDLPALPDDEELRRQVDVAGLFPLVLRFVYSGQLWESIEPQVTAENAMGLFALGELLEIRPLAARAFGFLETSVLTPETSARLLYAAARLARATPSSSSRGGGGSFDEPVARCTEVLRQGFEQVCSSPEDLDLLCRLPVDMLQPLLEADELEVLSEATVLEVARRLLRGRMRREEALVTLEGGRLSGAKAAGAPVGGVICEALVVEAPSPEVLLRARAEAPKYSAATDALQLQSGECELGKDLVLRIPKGAFGPGKPGTVAVRVRAAVSREVLLVGSLPSASLPLATAGEGAQTEVSLTTPDGKPGGTLRFKWKAEAAPPEEPVAAPPAEGAEGEGADGGGDAVAAAAAAAEAAVATSAAQFAATISEEQASKVLEAVRFSQLEHKDLLAAIKDPVLLEAGAQQRILEALSSRLDAYESAGQEGSKRQEPRPSTVRRSPGEATANSAELSPVGEAAAATQSGGLGPMSLGGPATSQAALGRPPAPADAAFGGAYGSAALRTRSAGRRVGGPGAGGHPLFPCAVCNAGSLVLRQRDLRWTIECSRYPSCNHAVLLPSSIMAAAVDGHCASCTLRLNVDVRTLTVRVGHQHAATLLKLPGGVDTLRGMCVAGCNDTLQRLGD